jgi:hypothetical protein
VKIRHMPDFKSQAVVLPIADPAALLSSSATRRTRSAVCASGRLARRQAGRIAARSPCQRMDASVEGYFTRSKTRCDAIGPIMPSIVIVLPSALRVVLDVPVPPGPVTEPS